MGCLAGIIFYIGAIIAMILPSILGNFCGLYDISWWFLVLLMLPYVSTIYWGNTDLGKKHGPTLTYIIWIVEFLLVAIVFSLMPSMRWHLARLLQSIGILIIVTVIIYILECIYLKRNA